MFWSVEEENKILIYHNTPKNFSIKSKMCVFAVLWRISAVFVVVTQKVPTPNCTIRSKVIVVCV